MLPALAGVSKLEMGAGQARRKLETLLNKLGYKLDFQNAQKHVVGGKTDESSIQDHERACSSVFLKDFELVSLCVGWFD